MYIKKIEWALLVGLGFCIFCFIGLAPAHGYSISNYDMTNPPSAQQLSLETVKKMLADEGRTVLQATEYYLSHILVESKADSLPDVSYFEIFNLETGARSILPTNSRRVRLEKIVNENEIVFLADGTNFLNFAVEFPFKIKCSRKNEQCPWNAVNVYPYLPIDQPSAFGDCKKEKLVDVKVTTEGLEAVFDPVIHHGAYESIPPTCTSYLKDKRLFLVSFKTVGLDPTLKKNAPYLNLKNSYFSSIEIKEEADSVDLILHLTESAKLYLGKTCKMKTAPFFPYIALTFAEEIEEEI